MAGFLLVAMHFTLCSLLLSYGPRWHLDQYGPEGQFCGDQWPCSSLTTALTFGWVCWCGCNARCVSSVVVMPRMLRILVGMDQKELFALSHIFYVKVDLGSCAPRFRQSPGWCLPRGAQENGLLRSRCVGWYWTLFLRALISGSHLFDAGLA